jgi:tRNA-Thr(GGU) m(6)t(6)A37 methyltransferase TsaA
MQVIYRPIGVIHSPFHDLEGMPIQPVGDSQAGGTVELFPQFSDGLKDLAGFSHIYLIYHLHMARVSGLTVIPFLDSEPRGLFATRAPSRPNPIGLSLVKLVAIEDNILTVESLDILDGTPLLDIKPYVPLFEKSGNTRIGWLENGKDEIGSFNSDRRFID